MISFLLPTGDPPATWCRCKPPQVREIAPRLVLVERRDRTTVLLPVQTYCATCRGVLSPEGIVGRVSTNEHQYESTLISARAKARGAVGKGGSSKTLGLRSWNLLDEFVSMPYVRVATTYTDWQRGHNISQVRNTLRHQVGLIDLASNVAITSAWQNKIFYIDHKTVDHVLQTPDADHLSFFLLTPATVTAPLEVWEVEADGHYDFERLYFMRIYRVGRTITTHLTIVNRNTARIVTAYRLNDADSRADGHRRGKLLFSSWDRAQ